MMGETREKETPEETDRFLKSRDDTSHDQTRDHKEAEEKSSSARPSRWKLNVFALFSLFFGFGFASSTTGPTMVDMGERLYTGTSGMAIAVTAGNVGYLIGSVLCGALYGRFQSAFQLLLYNMLSGVILILTPWVRNLIVYSVFCSAGSVVRGLIDSIGQGYFLTQMEGHRLKNPALQFMHCLWSAGATLGAFTIKPFLKPDRFPAEDNNITKLLYNTTVDSTQASVQSVSFTSLYGPNTTNVTIEASQAPSRVAYAYLTIGCITIALGIPMFMTWITGPKQCYIRKAEKKTEDEKESDPRTFRLVLLTLLFIFFFFYTWADELTASFMPTFVIKHLGWPSQKGPLIASTLWGSSILGRVFVLPISYYATPRQMMIGSLSLTLIAFSMLWALMNIHEAFVWLSVALVGLGMPSCFGTTILWLEQYLRIDGIALAVIMGSCSAGAIVPVLFTGYLIEYVSPMWLIYQQFGATAISFIFYVTMEIAVLVWKQKGNTKDTDRTTEINVEPEQRKESLC